MKMYFLLIVCIFVIFFFVFGVLVFEDLIMDEVKVIEFLEWYNKEFFKVIYLYFLK